MKTATEIKFDSILRKGFQEILKPLGFRKKGNNFYSQRQDLGHILNLQKSSNFSKDHISFTINIGIFIPEYWDVMYNYHDNDTPSFPIEPVCAIRKRIGNLSGKGDLWFEITEQIDENLLIGEMHQNLNTYILPYFERVSTKAKLIRILGNENIASSPLGRLIIYGEYNLHKEAKEEYLSLLSSRISSTFRYTVKEYGLKYGLE